MKRPFKNVTSKTWVTYRKDLPKPPIFNYQLNDIDVIIQHFDGGCEEYIPPINCDVSFYISDSIRQFVSLFDVSIGLDTTISILQKAKPHFSLSKQIAYGKNWRIAFKTQTMEKEVFDFYIPKELTCDSTMVLHHNINRKQGLELFWQADTLNKFGVEIELVYDAMFNPKTAKSFFILTQAIRQKDNGYAKISANDLKKLHNGRCRITIRRVSRYSFYVSSIQQNMNIGMYQTQSWGSFDLQD